LCGASLGAFLLLNFGISSAHAQGLHEKIVFSIKPMKLDEALRALAVQSGVQIIFPPDVVEGYEATDLSGSYTVFDALEIMLSESGLEFSFTDADFIAVKSNQLGTVKKGERGDSDEIDKTAKFAGGQNAIGQKGSSYEGGISGRVVSAATGKPLSGASISISSLGITVFSDEDGQYVFRAIPPGDYSIRISLFGHSAEEYPIRVDEGDVEELPIEFGRQSVDVIIVTGIRSAYNNSVNTHRSVDNVVSILAADLSGQFPDDTIAEALRRSPGVSFERAERGGEGEFVSIRGFDAAFNFVTVNGMAAPTTGLGENRRVPLDSYQADSISRIVVYKTLLPHQPSEGIGGIVDIVTVAPLDASDREISMTMEGRYTGFNDRVGFLASGQYIDRVGADDNIGIFASATFRRRLLRTYQFDVLGSILPASLPISGDGTPISELTDLGPEKIDASELSQIEDIRFNVFDDRRDTLTATAGVAWRIGERTEINVTSIFNRRDINTTRSTLSFEQADAYVDTNVSTGEFIDPDTQQFFFSGVAPFVRYRAEVEDESRKTFITSLSAKTELSKLELRYGGGVAIGRDSRPISTEIDFSTSDLSDPALAALPVIAPTDSQFITFDLSNPDVPAPQLTDAGFTLLAEPQNFGFRDIFVHSRQVRDNRYSAFVDAQFQLDSGPLQSARFGIQFSQANRMETRDVIYDGDNIDAGGVFSGNNEFSPVDANLLTGSSITLDKIGNPVPDFEGIFETDRMGVLAFRDRLLETVPGSGFEVDSTFIESNERTYAGFTSLNFEFTPKFHLTGGVRVEQHVGEFRSSQALFIDGLGVNFAMRADPVRGSRRRTTEILPRMIASYRPYDEWLIKAGMFESIARPRYDTISRAGIIKIDLDSGVASIKAGEPSTPNIRARNFDFSVQYFGVGNSYFEINAFYKSISNFRISNGGDSKGIFEAGSIEDLDGRLPENFAQFGIDLSSVTDIEIRRPITGVRAEAYGVDISYLHQFADLPGGWDGLGIRGSVGVQKTDFILDNGEGPARSSEFINAPVIAGTVGLWYQKYGVNAYAIYSYQSRQLNSVESIFPDEFVQSYSALDFRLEYQLNATSASKHSIYLAVSDVLDNGVKPTTQETIGRSQRLLDDIEFNGREIRFGVQASF